jgi:formamidopyrimidine-DNA glycosylase
MWWQTFWPRWADMPELVEVELYRRMAAPLVGAIVTTVTVADPRFLRGPHDAAGFSSALTGRTVSGVDRIGKLLLVRTDGPTLGLRFGMTGVLGIDGADGLDELVYGPSRRDPAWVRVRMVTSAGELFVRDPRILGSAELDPDTSAFGPDATVVTAGQLATALSGSRTPVKARLLDQRRVAGIGNLMADEMLWRASLAPQRPAGSLSAVEVRRLHRHVRSTVVDLLARGGSHRGRMTDQRRTGGRCPKDGTPLLRATVGGRTTWWCPSHQVHRPGLRDSSPREAGK